MADEMEELIRYEVENGIAFITLNRPAQLNALTRDMRRHWRTVVQRFNGDAAVRVGVLMGAGERAFSVGADMKEAAERSAKPRGPVSPAVPVMPTKPLIAAIHGYCLAGGMELSLMCDIRVASQNARFGMMEVRRSLLPSHAVTLLPRLVPRGEAAYMLLTGELVDAKRALRAGLIQEIALDKAATLERAKLIAQSIMQGAPLAIAAVREMLALSGEMSLADSYARAATLASALRATDDAREGPRAFAENRRPNWKGS